MTLPPTDHGWLPVVFWTVGVPVVLVSFLLSVTALGGRYGRQLALVPEDARFGRQFLWMPWFARHRLAISLVIFVLGQLSSKRGLIGWAAQILFVSFIMVLAVLLAGWGGRLLLSRRDPPTRVYGIGLLVAALFWGLFAIGYHELCAYHPS